MIGSNRTGTRLLAGFASVVTIAGVSVPLLATAAAAATTAVSVNTADKTANNSTVAFQGRPADNTHTFGGTATNDVNGPSTIRFVIESGPNADLASNGATAADGTCTAPTATTFSCTYTNGTANGAPKTGTDAIRVFADVNNNSLLDTGEASDTASKTFSGAPFSLNLTPDSDSAATGTCNPFTATVRDAGGRPAATGTIVDIVVTQTSTPAATAASDVRFCDPALDGGPGGTNAQIPAGQAPASGTGTGATGTRRGEVTTNADGIASFGIVSDQAGTFSVRGFVEDTNNNTLDAGEPTDVSTKTFNAGGAEGVKTLVASPKTATNFLGEQHEITATVTNAAGDPVSGVTPLFDVTAGPNAAANNQTACQVPSNQAGQAKCRYTGTVAGTDTIIVFVNQTTTANGTPGPDASEPQDTVQKTYVAGTAGTTVDITCEGTTAGGTKRTAPAGETAGAKETREETCVNPTSDPTETFTATVTTPDTNADGNREIAAGVPVRFTVTPSAGAPTTDDDVTPRTATVTTDAKGQATITVTNPAPAAGDNYTVTATTPTNTTTAASDTASKSYQAPVATTVTVSPPVDTNQVNTNHAFTVNVKDQFGAASAGQNVDVTITGRNTAVRNDLVTDASGNAGSNYTDVGSSLANGTDTITARVDNVTENDLPDAGEPTGTATKQWITEATTAGQVDLDVDSAVACETGAAAEATKASALGASNEVCVTVRTASGNNVLANQTVTITLTGVGTFADGTKTATGTTDGNGQFKATATSTQSGDQNLSAAVGSLTDTGVITYAAPGLAQARNIDLKPDTSNLTAGSSTELTARVTDRFGNPVQGVTVDFNETGPARFSNGTSSASATTGPTGTASVTLVSDAGTTGTETVTATIRDGAGATDCELAKDSPTAGAPAGTCSDSSTFTFAQPGATARTIDLTPATATATSGSGTTLTATVKDAAGAGVANVTVTFSETGVGGLNGTTNSSTTVTTNASGVATVTTTSGTGDSGSQTITASISAADTDCDLAAGTPTGAPAGICSDSSTVTYSGSSTGSAPTVTVNPGTINAGGSSLVTVRGTPGQDIQLLAYSRPSTTYRVVRTGTITADGTISFRVIPVTNTRLFARSASGSGPSVVISVRSTLSLSIIRGNGCTALFQGRVRPARAGQLVQVFYRSGSAIRIAGSTRVGADGIYRYSRAFQACGQTITFFTRTGTDITNLGGVSADRRVTFIR